MSQQLCIVLMLGSQDAQSMHALACVPDVGFGFSLQVGTASAGFAINSVEELSPDALGHAGAVYEHVLGEEKYTFVEGVQNPHSVTILIKGPSDHTLAQARCPLRGFCVAL